MSIFIKEMIKNKIKQLHQEELLQYARQYGFTLSNLEAQQILHYLQENEFDIFSKKEQEKAFIKLTVITNKTTANKAQKLLEQIISSYGLEDYFY